MGKNLRTPQTLVYEEWMEEVNTSQSVVEYILQLNNRLKRCQDIAITRMKECQLKRKTWYDHNAMERKFVEGDLVMVLATSKQNKLEVNWIGPGKIGQSDYTSPLILVESPKKTRPYGVDYRRLNEITRAEFFLYKYGRDSRKSERGSPCNGDGFVERLLSDSAFTPRAQRYAAFVTPFGTYIPKKMMFGVRSRSPSDLKIKAIADFPRPTTKTQVRSFLGLVVLLSLYPKLQHNSFTLDRRTEREKIKKEKITCVDEKCGKAFEELKAKLVSQPILYAPDFATDFILQTDASERLDFSAGCDLDQQLSDHSTVDEIASGATMANCPQRRLENREKGGRKERNEKKKEKKRARKRQGLVVLGSREENPRVLLGDADQESETRMSKNVLRTGRRQAVE
ncbi:retrovirus-related Pol polyprotein from transposon 297 [Trichonephila clavipes]|nr:retrovirus-related Pol polyprotein from transposon 297 [Trichonephila clavipes]